MQKDLVQRPQVVIESLGDAAVLVRFGKTFDPLVQGGVQTLASALDRTRPCWLVECVPAFVTVGVFYDPQRAGEGCIRDALRQMLADLEPSVGPPPRTVEVPVCYGGEFGPDLEAVARHAGLSCDEVVRRHAKAEYRVAMIGFAPGFPYLAGMPAILAMPRRETPRLRVAAGSVAIAGEQTGIYPLETPGGWQLIGRTPLGLFRPEAWPPSLLAAGDGVRFRPIDRVAFDRWQEPTP